MQICQSESSGNKISFCLRSYQIQGIIIYLLFILLMSKQPILFAPKFYKLYEKKDSMKVEPKSIVTIKQKEYVKFPFDQIFVNQQAILFFIIEANSSLEFEYVRIQISLTNLNKKIAPITSKQITKNLRKESPHQMVFTFRVSDEGQYNLRTTVSYKQKINLTSSQTPQKSQSAAIKININRMFDIKQRVFYIQKQKLLTYPLLVQYTVENLTDKSRIFKTDFVTDKFFVQNLQLKPYYQLNPRQSQAIVFRLSPKDLLTLYQTNKLGQFRVLWDRQGKQQRDLVIKFQQLVLIKATALTKSIHKRDINVIQIRFEKKYNFNFKNIEIQLKESQMQNIKILKINKIKFDFAENSSEQILELSVIGITSGHHLLKGIKLLTYNNLEIPYENLMSITVNNQQVVKQQKQIFQKTDVFDIFDV